ncbi:uncharacterized protein J3R85_014658 [Psidium guajava]|nr:uncharacterized protein J3R85_014658 [Psidium guajava]
MYLYNNTMIVHDLRRQLQAPGTRGAKNCPRRAILSVQARYTSRLLGNVEGGPL